MLLVAELNGSKANCSLHDNIKRGEKSSFSAFRA